MFAQPFDVGNQVFGAVVFETHARVGHRRSTASAAPLVELDEAVGDRIEGPAAAG